MHKSNGINISLDMNKAFDQTLGPLATTASQTLASAWNLSFGYIDHINQKAQLKRKFELDQFKKEIELMANNIPNDNFLEPELSKVGPVLEASKYYFEEEDIRMMFAKLIASSMDKTKVKDVYPSFSEVIKQMSKLDAQNLNIIYNSKDYITKLSQIRIPISTGGELLLYKHLFIDNPENYDYESNAASLTNLQRLGLIELNYGMWFKDVCVYDNFKNTNEYKEAINYQNYKNSLEKDKNSINVYYEEPYIIKGLVSVTSFGKKFCRICL